MKASRLLKRIAIGAVLAAMLGGCSSGSSNGSPPTATSTPTPTPTSPPGRGTLVVTVTDGLGHPLPGATIWVNSNWPGEDKYGTGDATGRAVFPEVLAGRLDISAFGAESEGTTAVPSLAASAVLEVSVVALPAGARAGGVTRALVVDGGLARDGQTLEFSLDILQIVRMVGGNPFISSGEYWAWGPDAVRVMACTPDPSNDSSVAVADCVVGPDGNDSGYVGESDGRALSLTRIESAGAGSTGAAFYSAALLLDQSARALLVDPEDRRLFAAKYFLNLRAPNTAVALAAFASDDPMSSLFSALPQKPVSIFPVEEPRFVNGGSALFTMVDQLGSLEGGAAPVYAAIDRMLDFVAAGPARESSAVVVMTNGRDTACGSSEECQTQLVAVARKSRETGIRIITVGVGHDAAPADHRGLSLLAQGADGSAAVWVEQPAQLAMALGNVSDYLSGSKDRLRATFRIRSDSAGAFKPGQTVLGWVRLEVCPFECEYTYIPFAIPVP